MKKINTFFVGLSVVLVVVVSMFASPAQAAEEVDGRARNGNDALRGINGDGRGSRNEHVALKKVTKTETLELETISIAEGTGFEGWIVTFDYPNDEPEVCNVARAVLSGRTKPAEGTATVNLTHHTVMFIGWKTVDSFTDANGNQYPCM
jgi:hypothetical protein